jgi:hypothetical protein
MKPFLKNILISVIVLFIVVVILHLNKIAFSSVGTFYVIIINFVSIVYVVLLIHRLIKQFENENNL